MSNKKPWILNITMDIWMSLDVVNLLDLYLNLQSISTKIS